MNAEIYPSGKPPLPQALRETLESLLQIVPADMVFLKDYSLYIIPGASTTHGIHEYKVMLDGAEWNRTGYTWALYQPDDVRQGIDEGLLFYNTVFTTQWLIYDNGRSALPLPLPLRVARTQHQGQAAFAFGYRQSQGFRKCAAALTSADDGGLAAFMLHQSVEHLLRGFIIAVTGREVKTHTLADLMKHALRYAPMLKASGASLNGIMQRLEKAYVCGRYSPHFHISRDMLAGLSAEVGMLQEEVKEQFHRLMEHYIHSSQAVA